METQDLVGNIKVHETPPERMVPVMFEQHGVFIHVYDPSSNEDKILGGTLMLLQQGNRCELEWKPEDDNVNESEHETQVLSGTSSVVVGCDNNQREPAPEQAMSLDGLKGSNDPDWTVVANSMSRDESSTDIEDVDSTQNEGTKFDFTVPLEDIKYIKKSHKGVGWVYLMLELYDGASLPPLHFHQGGSKKFLKVLKGYVVMTPSVNHPRTIEVTSHNQNALTQSFDELNIFGDNALPKFSTKFLEHPVSSAFSGFSKVTNFLQDMLNPAETTPQTRPSSERATVIQDDATEAVGSSRIQIKNESEASGGFEVITCADLGPRSHPVRSPPISVEYWNNHKDEQGRILGVDEIKQAIFRGGVDPILRKEVWKYLLNYFEWNMTQGEIKEHKRKKEEEYYRMKLQWKSVGADQESRFSVLRDNKSLIDKDVNRTDRTRLFYEGQENISLKLLNDVLVTYCMYNFDLGYVQGMNDLLSPILEIMGSEVDAFWCFVGYMNIVQHNFDVNQNGMKRQLQSLRTLIQFLDPKFFDNLVEKDSSNLYFCFRWLLLRFKREFSFEDIQTLWEVIWTELPCPNFHLLICVSVLDTEKPHLMHKECGFTEILKHINDLSGKIDLELTLRKAEGIYLQLSTCKRDLSDAVRHVLSLSNT